MTQEPIHAVLTPPDLCRFREITGVGDAELDVSFLGWSKFAVLTRDRVFMFPRRGRDAELLQGARVCEVLSSWEVPCVPRVLERWPDGMLAAGPFVAFERRHGVGWNELEDHADLEGVERMLRSLGGVIATWHRIPLTDLPADLRQPAAEGSTQPWINDLLDPQRLEGALDEVAGLLHATQSWSDVWRKTLRGLAAMRPVLVHGDVCEGQLLVDAHGRVDTVLDWDTARAGHPLHDFDFGEWGFGIFAWEAEFARLRHAMWEGYRAGRPGVDLPGADDVHLLFALRDLAYFEQRSLQGSLDDWGSARLAHCRKAIGPAAEAVSR